MRAIQRTSLTCLGLLCLSLGVSAGFFACTDAVHLDPPGTGGGAARGDGGGCRSNPDCPYPTPLCDAVSGICVECLVVADCAAKMDTVCSLGACVCPSSDGAALTYCPNESSHCVDTRTSPTNCGVCGRACATGCVGGVCGGVITRDAGAEGGSDGGRDASPVGPGGGESDAGDGD